MSEETSGQGQFQKIPAWAWPWICGVMFTASSSIIIALWLHMISLENKLVANAEKYADEKGKLYGEIKDGWKEYALEVGRAVRFTNPDSSVDFDSPAAKRGPHSTRQR